MPCVWVVVTSARPRLSTCREASRRRSSAGSGPCGPNRGTVSCRPTTLRWLLACHRVPLPTGTTAASHSLRQARGERPSQLGQVGEPGLGSGPGPPRRCCSCLEDQLQAERVPEGLPVVAVVDQPVPAQVARHGVLVFDGFEQEPDVLLELGDGPSVERTSQAP